MPPPNLKTANRPLPALRDKIVVDVSTEAHASNSGFIAVVASEGDNQTIVFRTLEGNEDVTETGLSKGDLIGVDGIPVILTAVRAATGAGTVTSIVVGIL